MRGGVVCDASQVSAGPDSIEDGGQFDREIPTRGLGSAHGKQRSVSVTRVQDGLQLLRFFGSANGLRWLALTLRRRLYSRVISIGVRRDLDVYVAGDPAHDLAAVPPAKIPLEVRLLRPDDDLSFIADDPGI